MMWIWGVAAGTAIIALRRHASVRLPIAAVTWFLVTVLPYAFLTYMPRVPSRHIYLPSLGLAFLVAAASLLVWERARTTRRLWVPVCLAAVMVAHNAGYIWIKKHRQFLERARPTEDLLETAASTRGVIRAHCFPYGTEIAYAALELIAERPRTDFRLDSGEPAHCYGSHPDSPAAAGGMVPVLGPGAIVAPASVSSR
jgi:hypothetical protein